MGELEAFVAADSIEKLHEHWITSVGDLYAVLEEDETVIAKMLNMSEADVGTLHEAVTRATNPAQKEAVLEELSAAHPLDDVSSPDDAARLDSSEGAE